jgi:5-methylcytosine-specific restriction endonuclease McrA
MSRGSTGFNYRGKAWKDLSRKAWKLYGRVCRFCGHQNSGRFYLDHIKPVRERPDLAMDIRNLQPLCARCHNSVKQRMENRGTDKKGGVNDAGFPPEWE